MQADCRELRGPQAATSKVGKSASEGRAAVPQAVEEKPEGSCTPLACKNTWEGCKEPPSPMSQGKQVPEATPG